MNANVLYTDLNFKNFSLCTFKLVYFRLIYFIQIDQNLITLESILILIQKSKLNNHLMILSRIIPTK